MSPPIFVSWDQYTHIIPQIFSGKKAHILAVLFARRKKKIFDNRKYLRYILRIAKISVNISNIFCKSQKIPLKIPQKNWKKTYGSYMGSPPCTLSQPTHFWENFPPPKKFFFTSPKLTLKHFLLNVRAWWIALFDFGSGSGRVMVKSPGSGSGSARVSDSVNQDS